MSARSLTPRKALATESWRRSPPVTYRIGGVSAGRSRNAAGTCPASSLRQGNDHLVDRGMGRERRNASLEDRARADRQQLLRLRSAEAPPAAAGGDDRSDKHSRRQTSIIRLPRRGRESAPFSHRRLTAIPQAPAAALRLAPIEGQRVAAICCRKRRADVPRQHHRQPIGDLVEGARAMNL